MANWYVLYTRPCWEKKVIERLSKRKVECFCPFIKDYKQWNERQKTIFSPLIPSYIFVHVTLNELVTFKNIEGVINIIYWIEKPAIIRDIEIEMIKRFLNEHPTVYVEKGNVAPNEIVRLVNGPLIEEDGNVIAVSINKTKLILPTLGYSIIADVVKENVEIINVTSKSIKITHL